MKSSTGGNPTLSEVATRAGVGRASAARALGNYGSVSDDTRERVLTAARELGYETNELARSMSTGITKTIGVVLADIANPFFAGVLRGITDTAREHGYDAILANSDEREDLEAAAVRLLVSRQVDGLIVAPAGGADTHADHLTTARERGVPLVQIDRTLDALRTDAVVMDNRDAARLATQHLIDAGHRRIALAWGPRFDSTSRGTLTRQELLDAAHHDLSSNRERLSGYLDALDTASVPLVPDLVMTNEQTTTGAAQFTRAALDSGTPPTAFIASETDALLGVLEVLRERRLDIPTHISVIGFDDAPWAHLYTPPLTMVRQPVRELGTQASLTLLDRIRDSKGAHTLTHLEAHLINRDSVAPPHGT